MGFELGNTAKVMSNGGSLPDKAKMVIKLQEALNLLVITAFIAGVP